MSQEIRITDIQIGVNRRTVNMDKVAQLADSIKEVGLLAPVLISQDKVLVAGNHRLEAFKLLGRETIPFHYAESTDALRLRIAEIDENMMRHDYTELEQSEYLKERKELYEQLYPETKRGNSQANGMNKSVGNNVSEKISPTFSEDTAQSVGLTARTIQMKVKRANDIPQEIRDIIRDTESAKHGNELDLLAKVAKVDPEEAKELAEMVKEEKAETVKDAKAIHALLKYAPQEFVDFCLRMQFKESWRIETMKEWYDNNHSEHSKFSQVKFSGLLQIPDGRTFDVRLDNVRDLREAERLWAKVVRKLEMDAAQMDKRHAILKAPEEIHSVIYADPAWQYSNSGLNGAAEKHYSTMPTSKICTLLQDNGIKVQENAALFMWTTNSHIPDALEVIKAWGFEYKANFVWVKDTPAYGKLAFYNRGQHELLFVATRGKFTPFHDMEQLPTSIIQSPKGAHSAKPDETRDLIEKLYPEQRYIELFARNHEPRNRWVFWGNEEAEVVNAAA